MKNLKSPHLSFVTFQHMEKEPSSQTKDKPALYLIFYSHFFLLVLLVVHDKLCCVSHFHF